MKLTKQIVEKNVHDVLDKYLAAELVRDIEREIMAGVVRDLKENEPIRTMAETDFHDCVNELCLKCGVYHDEHNGACDGCRWLKPRRGW